MKKQAGAPKGFTLVELLVVITIIGILISLLLPAVQSAREAARRLQCGNNIKQLSLAAVTYHAALGMFPPSISATSSADSTLYNGNGTTLGAGWTVALLPYLEQQALYDSFDFSASLTDSSTTGRNYIARGTSLNAMLCPTDRRNCQVQKCTQNGGNWARGNYAANGGLCSTSELNWGDRRWCGVMGWNTSCSIDNISDGSSNTILVLEIRAGLTATDRRGCWAMGACGASGCWQQADGQAKRPNSCSGASPYDDNVRDCSTVVGSSSAGFLAECMLCDVSANSYQDQAVTRSLHPGGVNTAFCDGSVHFVSNYIESGTYTISGTFDAANCLTWQRLNLSRDGLPLDGSKF